MGGDEAGDGRGLWGKMAGPTLLFRERVKEVRVPQWHIEKAPEPHYPQAFRKQMSSLKNPAPAMPKTIIILGVTDTQVCTYSFNPRLPGKPQY
jgi:hypothetical protein